MPAQVIAGSMYDARPLLRAGGSATVPVAMTLLIATSLASFRFRPVAELWSSGGFDAQVKFQAATWCVLGLVALHLLHRRRADLRLLGRGPLLWYCGYVALAAISTAYSSSPALTLYRSGQLGVAIVLVISLREHLSKFYLLVAAYLATNWLLLLVGLSGIGRGLPFISGPNNMFVAWGGTEEGPWRFYTAYGHPSQISIVAAVAAVGLAARIRREEWSTWGWVLGWFILSVGLTISRTAVAGLLGGLLIVLFGRRALMPFVIAAGFFVPLLMMSETVQRSVVAYLLRGQSEEEFASLTGRDVVYEDAIRRAQEVLLTGQGFRANRKQLLDERASGEGTGHSHNLILEAVTGMGILGGACVTLVFLTLTWCVLRIMWRERFQSVPGSTAGWEFFAMLAPIGAFCILDAGYAVDVNPFIMTFLCVLARVQTVLLDGPVTATGFVPPSEVRS